MAPSARIYTSAGVVALLLATSCARPRANPRAHMLLDAEANGIQAKILLPGLRDGGLANALELLEQQIDCSTIAIDHSLSRAVGPERKQAFSTLHSLKAYRETPPRKREAVIPETDTEERAQKASRILDELK